MDTELVYSLLLDKALIAFLDTITITRYGHFTRTFTHTPTFTNTFQLQVYRMQSLLVAGYCSYPLQCPSYMYTYTSS